MMDYAVFSAVGDKVVNEDAVRVCRNDDLDITCFLLSDGLGGHGNGDVAARLVTNSIEAYVTSLRNPDPNLLAHSIDGAQLLLRREMERMDLPRIRTTLVMLAVVGETAQWAHVGDSRLYAFHRNKLITRTRDHSIPQLLFDQGEIAEEEIYHHQRRNQLLRALGEPWDEPWYDIDVSDYALRKGDSFLLCSDGFWEWINTKQVGRCILMHHSAEKSLHHMVRLVETAGSDAVMDNYSAILIRM